jgi:copper chaperone
MMKLKIDGMTCEHCVRAVSGALQEVPGVETLVEVSLDRGEALIEGSAETALLIEAVEAEGYHAEAVE